MEHTNEHAHQNAAHDEHEEHIHMPSPSLSPILLGFGMALLGLAIAPTVLRLPALVLGILGTGWGLFTWIYDEVRNAASAEEPADEAAPAAH